MSQHTRVRAQQKIMEAAPTKGSMLQRAAIIPPITPVHRAILQRCSNGVECEECRQKRLAREVMLQRATISATPVNGVPPIVHDVLNSPGQPLTAETRAFMEPRFGHDFSRVRVHTDARAAESAQAVNALAYTVGRDMVFGSGQYEPETGEGRRLLAHELTHVVQQGTNMQSLQGKLEMTNPADRTEQEAESVASAITDRQWFTTKSRNTLQLARQKPEAEQNTGTGKAKGATQHTATKKKPAHLTIDQVKSLIASNNKSIVVSNELLLCLIWKESGFDPKDKSRKSSATGLMQIVKGAVEDVNKNTPKGTHFKHSEMTDPAKNIQCGTLYLDMRINWAGGNLKAGLEGYGTGSGYADDILICEKCLKEKSSTAESCLTSIHP